MTEDIEFLKSRTGTKVENARAMVRLLNDNPNHTLATICAALDTDDKFIILTLGLNRLQPELVGRLKDGRINLVKAYSLAKLPLVEQAAFHRKHADAENLDYCIAVNCRVKEVKNAKRQAKVRAK